VLVVDDDADIREAVRAVLESDGYEVHTAANGHEALELLGRMREPCLILLDLMMPVLSGWEFLELRKRNHHLANLPVVVVSAVGDRVRPDPRTAVVRKPPDVDTLLKIVASHCEAMAARRAA
jgi:CheY-like chemotaxis protein